MLETIFRIYGEDFDIEKFLKISKWKPICFWKKGEKELKSKKIARNSGFNLEIYSSKKHYKKVYKNNLFKIINFIKNNDIYLKKIAQNKKVKMCIDIGVIEDKVFLIEINLKGEMLKLVYKYNIELIISIYP